MVQVAKFPSYGEIAVMHGRRQRCINARCSAVKHPPPPPASRSSALASGTFGGVLGLWALVAGARTDDSAARSPQPAARCPELSALSEFTDRTLCSGANYWTSGLCWVPSLLGGPPPTPLIYHGIKDVTMQISGGFGSLLRSRQCLLAFLLCRRLRARRLARRLRD